MKYSDRNYGTRESYRTSTSFQPPFKLMHNHMCYACPRSLDLIKFCTHQPPSSISIRLNRPHIHQLVHTYARIHAGFWRVEIPRSRARAVVAVDRHKLATVSGHVTKNRVTLTCETSTRICTYRSCMLFQRDKISQEIQARKTKNKKKRKWQVAQK